MKTAESVAPGHPDKVCDQISDTIVDTILAQDPTARVAANCWIKDNAVGVIGEITTKAIIDFERIIRNTLARIGYSDAAWGIDPQTCAIHIGVSKQSPNIAQGVDTGGAGDQGQMWGFACDETSEYLPLPTVLSHRLLEQLHNVKGKAKFIRPDGKSQVSVENGKVTSIVMAIQHAPVQKSVLDSWVKKNVILPICGEYMTKTTKIIINGTGTFEIGGPKGDSGLTGRKIIVDTYGSIGRHGGGAFSGKDPTKVDRSATYAARYIAKHIVAAKIARTAEIQLSYCIGKAEPTSIYVNTFGEADDKQLENIIPKLFPLKPKDIIAYFRLRNPDGWSYAQTAVFGHFGRAIFPWERLDKVTQLKKAYKK